MTPVVGGVTHDPINAHRPLEQARAASAIAVTRHHCIHRCHCCHRRRRSLLSSPLPPSTPPLLSLPRPSPAAAAAVKFIITCLRLRFQSTWTYLTYLQYLLDQF